VLNIQIENFKGKKFKNNLISICERIVNGYRYWIEGKTKSIIVLGGLEAH